MFPTLLAAATVSLPSPSPSLVERLEAEGFENVAVESREGLTYVWFEDRRTLDLSRGVGRVARLIDEAGRGTDGVELVPLWEGVPLLGITVARTSLRAFFAGTQGVEAFGSQLGFDGAPPAPPYPMANLSFGHPEVALTPGYAYSDRFAAYLNANLRVPLTTGWRAQGRLQLQVTADTALYPTYALLGGHRALAPRVDAAWSLGRWRDDRYGAEGEMSGWLGDGEWLWRVRAGLVTRLVPSLVASMEYRFPWADTYSRWGGGFFPAGDRALFVTFGRLFPRSELEAGYFRSDFGNQLRATLSIYLGSHERPDPKPFRVEVPGWLDLDYRASAPSGATQLWPGPEAGIGWRRLTPSYLKRRLSAWRSSP